MKNQHIALYTTVNLFLDLLKPVTIHQPDHPEDSIEGETPDVSHTVKDRNKVILRQLNYTWLPTPKDENLKGIISPTALKSYSMAGFTNLQKAGFLHPISFVQHFKDLSSPYKPGSALPLLEAGKYTLPSCHCLGWLE